MTAQHRLEVILNHLRSFPQYSSKSTSICKYLYTLDNNVLTNEQRAFYEENGYLLIRNLVDHKLLDECSNRFIDICNGKFEKGQMIIMKEKSLFDTGAKGEDLTSKIHDIFFDDVFIKYMKDPTILKYAECFTGPNITAFNSMLVNKPPTPGNLTGIHPLHQDLYYFPIRPAERIVACWTAMEKVDVDNGCLFVVPGSHKGPIHSHNYPKEYDVNFMFYQVEGFDSVPRVHLEMEKGDTVFFHPLLCHGSGANTSKRFRKAIACHYASNDCFYIDKWDDNHKNVLEDVMKVMAMRGLSGSELDFHRLRQTLVKGKPGRLHQI